MPNMEKPTPQPVIKKKAQTNPFVITGLLGGLILVAGYFIYVAPAARDARELSSKDILALEVRLGDKQTRLFTIKRLAKDFDNLPVALVEKLTESLPPDPRSIDLLVNLTSLVAESGLILKGINITDPSINVAQTAELAAGGANASAVSGPKELPVTIDVEGVSYSVLKKFAENLEKNLRLLSLDSFSFDGGSPDISFEMRAFYSGK